MAEATIPVDLRNPGQVFACLGLMEAAAVLFGVDDRPAEVFGRYAWNAGETTARFTIGVAGKASPVLAVVQFLARAKVQSVAPKRLNLNTEDPPWRVPTDKEDVSVFPFSPPESLATLPAQLLGVGSNGAATALPIEYWGDSRAIGRDNVKFWAGAGGCPGVALARDAVHCISELTDETLMRVANDPFRLEARMSSSFRFDWRRDYVPRDAGFSPNKHTTYKMVGYPLVELLAAIGLQHARPQRIDKLNYRYAAAATALPLSFARALLGGQALGFAARTFRMRLGWPGQENKDRCILDAQEEFQP